MQVVQGAAARVSDSRVNADILYDDNSAFLDVLRNIVGARAGVGLVVTLRPYLVLVL